MAENLDAELYRQALRLVLGELEDLDAAHAVDVGYRIGELKVHLRTLIGESGRPPMLGLRGAGGPGPGQERAARAVLPITTRTSTAAPDLRQRGGPRWSPCWRILLRQTCICPVSPKVAGSLELAQCHYCPSASNPATATMSANRAFMMPPPERPRADFAGPTDRARKVLLSVPGNPPSP